jgi:hypothetical protein
VQSSVQANTLESDPREFSDLIEAMGGSPRRYM